MAASCLLSTSKQAFQHSQKIHFRLTELIAFAVGHDKFCSSRHISNRQIHRRVDVIVKAGLTDIKTKSKPKSLARQGKTGFQASQFDDLWLDSGFPENVAA